MPSPIGHTAAALILLALKGRLSHWREIIRQWRHAFFFILLANLPDIDLINPHTGKIEIKGGFHHQELHSIGFAMAIALLVGAVIWIKQRRWSWQWVFWSFLAVGSHVFLDWLISNKAPGMPIFFPFSSHQWSSPFGWAYALGATNLFGVKNWIRVFVESSISLGCLAGVVTYFAFRKRSTE